MKQILMDIKVEIDNNTVIVEEFNSSFTSMDTFFRTENKQEIGNIK